MRIRLLGTGTPTPSLKRMSAGYLVETADRKILLDFGPGDGWPSLLLAPMADEVVGVDASRRRVDQGGSPGTA